MAYLRSLDDQIQIHLEEGQNLLVGRLPICDVVIDDGSVSSQHARIQLLENQLRLVDMGSTNGTRVNYTQIDAPHYLLDGDTVEFGNMTFTVDAPGLQAPETDAHGELTELRPLASSQKLSDTYLSIAVPSEADLQTGQTGTGVETFLDPVPSPFPVGDDPVDPQTFPPTDFEVDPLLRGFLLALFLLLLWGALLLLHFRSAFPG